MQDKLTFVGFVQLYTCRGRRRAAVCGDVRQQVARLVVGHEDTNHLLADLHSAGCLSILDAC